MTRRLEMALTRIFRRREAPPAPGHQVRLEDELLARFGELHPNPSKEKQPMTTFLWRAAAVAGLALAVAGASQAPADWQAEIGKRITVTSDAPLGPENVRAMSQAVEAGGHAYQVRVRGMREPGQPVKTVLEVYGDTVALGDVAAKIRQAVPAVAALPITVEPIEHTVEGDLGDKVKHLIGQDQLPPDELKRLIEAEIHATDPGAQVKVEVVGDENHREVSVEVKKQVEVEEPAPAAPAK